MYFCRDSKTHQRRRQCCIQTFLIDLFRSIAVWLSAPPPNFVDRSGMSWLAVPMSAEVNSVYVSSITTIGSTHVNCHNISFDLTSDLASIRVFEGITCMMALQSSSDAVLTKPLTWRHQHGKTEKVVMDSGFAPCQYLTDDGGLSIYESH
jgi:hypothetical protein